MASIVHDGNGFRRCLFYHPADGLRKGIRLGKCSKNDANVARAHIEDLITSLAGIASIQRKTAEWVRDLPDTMYEKLAGVGLLLPRKKEEATPTTAILLGAFVDAYIAGREPTAKPNTITNLKQARKDLVGYFTAERNIATITEGDAEEFAQWLSNIRKLSQNTARRICGRSVQFFQFAVKKKHIAENPFAGLKTKTGANMERDHFVDRETVAKCMAVATVEWRAIIALSRYGGLRTPSETLLLRWVDVDWDANKFIVHSPKTEGHEGRETRVVPLFPELRAPLLEAFSAAEPGAEFVVTTYRDGKQNLRSQLLRIIRRAKVQPWEKLFANMRMTRATELAQAFPGHVAAEWMGHSERVAQKHYWRTTDADFAKATSADTDSVYSNSVRAGREMVGSAGKQNEKIPENPQECELAGVSVPPRGVEPLYAD